MHNKFPSALCELPYDPLELIFLIKAKNQRVYSSLDREHSTFRQWWQQCSPQEFERVELAAY